MIEGLNVKTFRWKTMHYPVDPQVVGEYLEEMAGDAGSVKPEQVVRDAERKESPLHPIFDWNNDSAAHKYRLHQARVMLGNLERVTIRVTEEGTEETEHIRAFVNVRSPIADSEDVKTDSSYMKIDVAMQDHRDYIIQRAKSELESFRRKYNELRNYDKKFGRLFKEVDNVLV